MTRKGNKNIHEKKCQKTKTLLKLCVWAAHLLKLTSNYSSKIAGCEVNVLRSSNEDIDAHKHSTHANSACIVDLKVKQKTKISEMVTQEGI